MHILNEDITSYPSDCGGVLMQYKYSLWCVTKTKCIVLVMNAIGGDMSQSGSEVSDTDGVASAVPNGNGIQTLQTAEHSSARSGSLGSRVSSPFTMSVVLVFC